MAKQKSSGWLDKYQEGGLVNKYIQNVPKTFDKGIAASDATSQAIPGSVFLGNPYAKEMAKRQTYLSPKGTSTSDATRQAAEDKIQQDKANAFSRSVAEGAQTLGAGLELAAPFTGPFMPLVGGVGAGLGVGSGSYLAGKDALAGDYGSAALNAGFAGLDAAGFAALRNPVVKDFVQGADHIADYQQVVDMTGVASSLDDRIFKNSLLSNVPSSSKNVGTFSDKVRELLRLSSLPEVTDKNSLKVLEDFKQRIQTPEGQRRLKELGITNDDWLQKMGMVEDPNTYGYYSAMDNRIALHPELSLNPFTKNVVRHEIEHGVQDAITVDKFNKFNNDVGNFKYLFRPGAKKKALEEIKKTVSPIDDILSDLELRKTPEVVDWDAIKESRDAPQPHRLLDYLSNKQNATNYFNSGSEGREKSAFLAEVQQYMLDYGYLTHPYDTVTPNKVKEVFGEALFDEEGKGKFLRLFNIMKNSDKNYNLIAEGLNKMLSAPTAVATGAAALSLANQPEQKKNGGWLDKYNDGGPVQPNYNDASVSMSEDFVGDGYSNVGRNYSPAWGGQFADGGEIAQTGKQVPFDQWYKTVPKSKNDTINYNLRRAYELAPQKDLDAFVKNPKAHLMSAYEDPNTGIYEFMKSKNHPTIQKELDWYNSKQGTDFRNNHSLDTSGDFYRYVPKEMAMGGSMPGAVGFTYARTIGPPAPSKGPHGKKTVASAQNGKEMKFYQNGLDFKPKSISKNGSKVIKDDMGQWNHPGEVTQIDSNQITMEGVPYPVMGISDTGDMQMMYPDEEYQYEGSSVTEYPMMAAGGVVEDPKKKKSSMINLGDLTMTPEELEYVNASNSGYCPGGNCLENTRKGYDMTAGRIPGIPSSGNIWTNDLQLISTASTPSDKLVQENPYFRGDTSFGSADSWDIQGAIVKAGGKNIYSQAKGQAIPKDIAIGSMIGWGPTGTRETSYSNRSKGMNKDYGLQPSHHSTQVVNYSEKGEPIVYDSYLGKYGTLSDISKDLKKSLGYDLENISVPKSVAGNTRENLAKKGLLKTEATPYIADVNKLLSGAKQPWAQIKEDGKMRAPKVNMDKVTAFAKALSDNKGELMSSLRLTSAEFDRLANTELAIQMVESEGGGALGFADSFGSTQGMTQLNPKNITNDARLKSALSKKYNNKSPITNLADPASSAIATMMYLSVADKDAKRLYNKGLKPGVKTFNQPGFIENFRSTNSRLNKDGVFIDELNKRIPYSEIPGYEDEDATQVNNYLKKLTKSDKYNFVNKDGDLSLKMKTKGNNPKLTDIEKIAYMWQSPNSLKTGDAEGKSEYVNKIKNYYNLLTAKKMEQGGQLTKLDQLTNFTNYNTKQPGGWLDKYQ